MPRKRRRNNSRTLNAVVKNIRADLLRTTNQIRKRIYHNQAGHTSAQILAEMGSSSTDILALLTSADSLVTSLATAMTSGQ